MPERRRKSGRDVSPALLRPAPIGPEPRDETHDIAKLLAFPGVQGEGLPERMAGIDEMRNALPPPMREALLIAYVNRPYEPVRGGGA